MEPVAWVFSNKFAAGPATMIDDTNSPSSFSGNHPSTDDFWLNSQQASALSHLRKESLDIYNRLHSIAEDIEFVKSVRAAYKHLPILREFTADCTAVSECNADAKISQSALRSVVCRPANGAYHPL